MAMYVCVFICVGCICVCAGTLRAKEHVLGQTVGHCLSSLRQVFVLIWSSYRLLWLAHEPEGFLCLLQNWGGKHMAPCAIFLRGFWGSNSGPQA